jgi:hypothetical protein
MEALEEAAFVLGDVLCPAVADLGMESQMSRCVFSATYMGIRGRTLVGAAVNCSA